MPAPMPALVAVAHGSRDPRSAATVFELLERVRRLRPGLDVRPSFLDLNAPRLPDALAASAAEGHRRAAVVPLLLGDAFHARVDVPGAVSRATGRHPWLRPTVADVLGADDRLTDLALRRLGEVAGPLDDPGLGVVVAAIGSSRPAANTAVGRLAAAMARRHRWHGALAAFATAASPTVPEAVARLRGGGAERVAVVSWFLAPGLLPTRVRRAALATDPTTLVAEPLGADAAVAEVILDRYDAALAGARLARVS